MPHYVILCSVFTATIAVYSTTAHSSVILTMRPLVASILSRRHRCDFPRRHSCFGWSPGKPVCTCRKLVGGIFQLNSASCCVFHTTLAKEVLLPAIVPFPSFSLCISPLDTRTPGSSSGNSTEKSLSAEDDSLSAQSAESNALPLLQISSVTTHEMALGHKVDQDEDCIPLAQNNLNRS